MHDTFAGRQRAFFMKLLLIALLLFALHHLFLYYFYTKAPVFYPLWSIYLFHTLTVFSIYTLVNRSVARDKKNTFYTFITLTFLKMLLAVVFLLPLLLSEIPEKQADVFNFFVPYFLFLGVEVYSITKFLQKI